MQRLKVLSLNIWHREAPWEARRELIRRGIAQLAPDLIGFQEVLSLTMANGRQSQADELCQGTPYSYVFGRAQTLGPGFEFGNALASRHPILEHEVFALPGEESGETRSVLYALVDTPFGDVPVFVTHLNWKLGHGSIRLRQVKRIVEIMSERAPLGSGFPALLLGDMNAEPDADEMRFLRGLSTLDGQSVYFADAWIYGGDGSAGYTFDRRNPYAARAHEPPRRIDYVFVRGPAAQPRGEPLFSKVVLDAPESGVWPSDHFGVYAEMSAGQ